MENLDFKSMLVGGCLACSVLLLTAATRLPASEPDPAINALMESLVDSQRMHAEALSALAMNGLNLNMPDSHTLTVTGDKLEPLALELEIENGSPLAPFRVSAQ